MDLPSSPVSAGSSPWEWVDSLSDTDGGSVREIGDAEPPPKVWWAQKLMMHTRTLGLMRPSLQNPVTCVSACTGSFAEGFVFEAQGSGFVCGEVEFRIIGVRIRKLWQFPLLRVRVFNFLKSDDFKSSAFENCK